MFRDFLAGATGRLLPASVPFRFFGAAVIFHLLGWATLVFAADDLPGFLGGPGLVLAALHMMTLGVAAMTAMGAAFQLLPVATKRPLRSVGACKLAFWLFLPGLVLLLWGMAEDHTLAMDAGGSLAVAGLLLFALLVADNLRQVRDMRVVTEHVWVALASLVLLVVLGLVLVADFSLGFLPDHQGVALAHAVIAAYGFMGMMALGFSFILVPMFTLAPQPDGRLGRRSAWLAAAALLLSLAGLVHGITPLLWLAGLAGLGAVGLHLWTMATIMKGRMKKSLGDSFRLIRLAWVMLPLSLMVGLAAASGVAVDRSGPLFGFLLVFGWLLSMLTGVLQRILPFLGSMVSVRPGIKPVLMSKLIAPGALRAHMVCHFAALALVATGIVSAQGLVVRLGAVVGLAGALAFAGFAANLWYQLSRHMNPRPQPSENT